MALVAMANTAYGATATVTVSGGVHPAVEITSPEGSGLDAVYVVDGTYGVTVTYSAASAGAEVEWLSYGTEGGGHAVPVTGIIRNGNTLTLNNPEASRGYLITEGSRHCYFWIADYSDARFNAVSLAPGTDNDCSSATLYFVGNAPRITYYSINGRAMEIDRRIELSWNSMAYNDDTQSFETVSVTESRPWLPTEISVDAPLCRTAFTVTGDRFLKAWGEEVSVSSPLMEPVAVDARTRAEQTERDADNEQDDGASELGGSGPVEITFTADVTPAAIFTEWQTSRYPEFDVIDLRSNDLEFTHTFRDTGSEYVRFVCANADASCEYYSDTYTISIGESALQIPNAFSPGATPGVNDLWKVSYKSIIQFECHIFNKWGIKMKTLSNPAQGWDGKYNGKTVPSGVYYYVIKAKGADGKRYNRSGDINIVGYN